VNFDGLPGPTHNYSGLARGNLAAERNAQQVANPREAALQGLAKMRSLATRGYAQGVLPPHERPSVSALRASLMILDLTRTTAESVSSASARAFSLSCA